MSKGLKNLELDLSNKLAEAASLQLSISSLQANIHKLKNGKKLGQTLKRQPLTFWVLKDESMGARYDSYFLFVEWEAIDSMAKGVYMQTNNDEVSFGCHSVSPDDFMRYKPLTIGKSITSQAVYNSVKACIYAYLVNISVAHTTGSEISMYGFSLDTLNNLIDVLGDK